MILLKVRVQYQKNLDFEASYFIQRHLRHAIELFLIYTIFDIFWQWCKNNIDPKYVSLKTAPDITIWQSYG